jgi:hypothetical protein
VVGWVVGCVVGSGGGAVGVGSAGGVSLGTADGPEVGSGVGDPDSVRSLTWSRNASFSAAKASTSEPESPPAQAESNSAETIAKSAGVDVRPPASRPTRPRRLNDGFASLYIRGE